MGYIIDDPEDIVASNSVPLINDIAQKLVDGYCLNKAHPLSLVNSAYSSVAQDEVLQPLAGNSIVRFEASIDATRADQFRADSQQPLQYVIEPPGAPHSIVIGGPNVPRAWLGYQCMIGEQAVIKGDPNTFTNALSAKGNFTCTPCTTVNEWWWTIPNNLTSDVRASIGTVVNQEVKATQRYIRVSEANRAFLATNYGGGGSYVASCS